MSTASRFASKNSFELLLPVLSGWLFRQSRLARRPGAGPRRYLRHTPYMSGIPALHFMPGVGGLLVEAVGWAVKVERVLPGTQFAMVGTTSVPQGVRVDV
ncbi:hypothetical protein ACQPXM_11420 [Kribbella sp. CA-253562]|uniref:hypothetical protein n=1 Tax=Kribbella sp. CA-253562 TaxID=3239942 RepID=UPI003D8E202E